MFDCLNLRFNQVKRSRVDVSVFSDVHIWSFWGRPSAVWLSLRLSFFFSEGHSDLLDSVGFSLYAEKLCFGVIFEQKTCFSSLFQRFHLHPDGARWFRLRGCTRFPHSIVLFPVLCLRCSFACHTSQRPLQADCWKISPVEEEELNNNLNNLKPETQELFFFFISC